MAYCLPPKAAAEFLKKLQDGSIDPDKLIWMESAERRAFFAKIVGEEDAKHVNTLFESKLVLKDQKRGLINWAKSVSGLSKPAQREFISRAEKLEKALAPSDMHGFLADFVEDKFGTPIGPEQAKKIIELTQAARKARDAQNDSLAGVSDDYLKAAEDLRRYTASLMPTTPLKSIVKNAAVAGRNTLLMNPATPIKTLVGQSENSLVEAVTRRLSSLSLTGMNGKLAREANRQAWATFRKTGQNVASMTSLEDTGRLGEGHNFDIQSGADSENPAVAAVEKAIRGYAKITNKVVIDWAHVQSFTKFYQKAFYDGLNILSSDMAKGEKLTGQGAKDRAEALFRDAAKIKPDTQEGAALRAAAQLQAARVTSTNPTWLSSIAMGLKDTLNQHVFPGAGDLLMPIAKIPATLIANGIENAGPGLPMGAYDIWQGREKMQSDDPETKYEGATQVGNGVRRMIRTAGAIAVGALISSYLTKKDFRQDNYGNNYVRFAGVWVNMEYFALLSPAVAGMMLVKKDGLPTDNIGHTAGHYVAGVASGLAHAPGIDTLETMAESMTGKDVYRKAVQGMEQFFASRTEPPIIVNMFKDRPINRLFFGAHGIESDADVAHDRGVSARKRHMAHP